VKALSDTPLATRELRQWFDHCQKAGHLTRERLVDHPHLFLAALEERIEHGLSEGLRDGPEGSCETAGSASRQNSHSVSRSVGFVYSVRTSPRRCRAGTSPSVTSRI
jgi:hypothetical protein